MGSEHEKRPFDRIQERQDRYRFVPCVVAVSGLPATGKSTLGRFLDQTCNFKFLDVDVIREEIDDVRKANHSIRWLPPDQELAIMTRSYILMCQRAEALAIAGTPVVIAGTFSRSQFKEPLQALKDSLDNNGLILRILHLTATIDDLEMRITKQKGKRGAANVDSVDALRWAQSIFSPIGFTEVREIDTKIPGHYLETFNQLNDLRSSDL